MACPPTTGLFTLMDYKGSFLTLSNNFNPVITQVPYPTPSLNQTWSVTRAFDTPPIIFFKPNPEVELLLSYSNASSDNGNPLFLQTTLGSDWPTLFDLNCINATSGNIVSRTSSPLALTSWPIRGGNSTITPVTYENLIGSPEQAWTFLPSTVSI
ncbi:hypothetical protein L218DRAFT_949260 [Marasmius fiardii PR-910]|nr:hypothetical protein L218DRAFT_949260 [Marasmius fiardii PR-910]